MANKYIAIHMEQQPSRAIREHTHQTHISSFYLAQIFNEKMVIVIVNARIWFLSIFRFALFSFSFYVFFFSSLLPSFVGMVFLHAPAHFPLPKLLLLSFNQEVWNGDAHGMWRIENGMEF